MKKKGILNDFIIIGKVTAFLIKQNKIAEKHNIMGKKTMAISDKNYMKNFTAFCKDVDKEIKRIYEVK